MSRRHYYSLPVFSRLNCLEIQKAGVPISFFYGSGFTFSVGGGLKYQPSDAIMLKAGYEFGRTYIGSGDSKSIYTGHTILVGASVQF